MGLFRLESDRRPAAIPRSGWRWAGDTDDQGRRIRMSTVPRRALHLLHEDAKWRGNLAPGIGYKARGAGCATDEVQELEGTSRWYLFAGLSLQLPTWYRCPDRRCALLPLRNEKAGRAGFSHPQANFVSRNRSFPRRKVGVLQRSGLLNQRTISGGKSSLRDATRKDFPYTLLHDFSNGTCEASWSSIIMPTLRSI